MTAAHREDRDSRGFVIALAIQGLGAVLAFGSQLVLARVLGPAAFGTVSAVVSISAIAGLVCTAGTGGLALRHLPATAAAEDHERMVAFAYRVTILTSLAFGVIGGTVALALLRTSLDLTISAILLSAATALWIVGSDVGRAIDRFVSTYGASVVLRPAVTIALVVVLGDRWGSDVGAVWALVALTAGGVVAIVVQLTSIGRSVRFGSRLGAADFPRDWLRESPTYLTASGITLLLTQTDLLVSALVLSPHELGQYAAAAKCAGLLSIVVGAINTVAIPRIARHASEPERLSAVARAATRWQFGLLTCVAVPMFVFAPLLLGIFGESFTDATSALRILIVGQLLNCAFGPAGALLIFTGRARIASLGYGVSVVVSAVACTVGAQAWGLRGAATGAALAATVAGVLLWALARRFTGVAPTAVSAFLRPRSARAG